MFTIPLSKHLLCNRAVKHFFGLVLGIFAVLFAVSMDPVFAADRALNEGEQEPWHITANRISALSDAQSLVAEGEVVVSRGDQRLRADKIVYDKETEIIEAQGDVELSVAGDILWCDLGTFNLRKRRVQ